MHRNSYGDQYEGNAPNAIVVNGRVIFRLTTNSYLILEVLFCSNPIQNSEIYLSLDEVHLQGKHPHDKWWTNMDISLRLRGELFPIAHPTPSGYFPDIAVKHRYTLPPLMVMESARSLQGREKREKRLQSWDKMPFFIYLINWSLGEARRRRENFGLLEGISKGKTT